MAASCILAYHVKQGTFLENELGEILTKSVQDLRRPPTRQQKRERHAQHKAARLIIRREERLAALKKRIEKQAVKLAYASGTAAPIFNEADQDSQASLRAASAITDIAENGKTGGKHVRISAEHAAADGDVQKNFDSLISTTRTPYSIEEELGDDLLERREEARKRVRSLFSEIEPNEKHSEKQEHQLLPGEPIIPQETIERMKQSSKHAFRYLSEKFRKASSFTQTHRPARSEKSKDVTEDHEKTEP